MPIGECARILRLSQQTNKTCVKREFRAIGNGIVELLICHCKALSLKKTFSLQTCRLASSFFWSSNESWFLSKINKISFLSAEGRVEVSREGKYLSTLSGAKVLGELAILYNCQRTATITAVTDCKLWAIERQCFQTVMMRSGIIRAAEYTDFLKR